jgi:hypothetical protein
MKIPMDYLLGSAGRALVVGGVLGWPAIASAQTPVSEPAGKSKPAHSQGVSANGDALAETSEHSTPIRVQLAWLSDRATYPFPLEAEMHGTVLEVRGYVPTETVHQQALKMARDESGLRVMDAIQVNPNVTAVPAKKSASALKREAVACLRQDLRERAAGITVIIWNDGQVLLKGRVPSVYDKLAASCCLRRVAGCNCVLNQLQVPRLAVGTRAMPTPELQPRRASKPLYAKTTWRPAEAPVSTPEPVQPQTIQLASLDTRSGFKSSPERQRGIENAPSLALRAGLETTSGDLTSPPVAKASASVPQLGSPMPLDKPPSEPGTLGARKPSSAVKTNSAFAKAPETKAAPKPLDANPAPEQRKPKEPKAPAQQVKSAMTLKSNSPTPPKPSEAKAPAQPTKNVTAVKSDSTTPKASGPPLGEQKQTAQTITIARPSAAPAAPKTEPTIIPVANWNQAATGSAAVAPLPPAPKPLTLTFDKPAAPAPQAPRKGDNAGPRSDGYVSTGVVLFSEPPKQEPAQAQSQLPKKEPARLQNDAYVSSGVILLEPEAKKAPAIDPTPTAARRENRVRAAVSHSDAYVSNGLILIDHSEKPTQPKVMRPELPLKQAHLQQSIAKACHLPTKDVEVKLLSEKAVIVRIKARSAQEGEALSATIFQMPELGPYQVSLDIPLTR